MECSGTARKEGLEEVPSSMDVTLKTWKKPDEKDTC